MYEPAWKKRCGITTDLEGRRSAHDTNYIIKRWVAYGPFRSREAAQRWEDGHDDTWEHHPGGRPPDDPSARWFGYEFYFSQRRPRRTG